MERGKVISWKIQWIMEDWSWVLKGLNQLEKLTYCQFTACRHDKKNKTSRQVHGPIFQKVPTNFLRQISRADFVTSLAKPRRKPIFDCNIINLY